MSACGATPAGSAGTDDALEPRQGSVAAPEDLFEEVEAALDAGLAPLGDDGARNPVPDAAPCGASGAATACTAVNLSPQSCPVGACVVESLLDAGLPNLALPDAAILAPDGRADVCRETYTTCTALAGTVSQRQLCAATARGCGFDPGKDEGTECAALFARCFAEHPFDFDLCIAMVEDCERQATDTPGAIR